MAKYESIESLVQAIKRIDMSKPDAYDRLQSLHDISDWVQQWVDHDENGAVVGMIETALREGHIADAKKHQRELRP